MRHTLLPLEERKALRRDYWERLLCVFFVLFTLVFVAGMVVIFPVYMSAVNVEKSEQAMVAQIRASKEAQGRGTIEAELRKDGLLASKLSENVKNYRPSEAIRVIVGERGSSNVTSITYNIQGTSTIVVVLQGRAETRNSLIEFKERIAAVLPHAKIDLPLSELAKSKDIAFSMKVSYPMP